MLRITVLRVRVFFAVLGCAILGASLVDWAQTLRAAESGYAWVRSDSSSAPAAETAEIWRASARCMRPFFVDAVLQSKARLKSYYDLVPAEVQASRTRPTFAAGAPPSAGQNGSYRLVSDQPSQSPAQLERGAMLHARYAEWYANVFKLEIEAHQWEARLNGIADQSVTVSEATRASFSAGHGIARGMASGDFDRNLMALLGVSGFRNDQEQALLARCVTVVPVKKVLQSARYVSELWRWPVDHAAAFSFGIELVLIAIFFVPIDLWIGTGDARAVWRHVAAAAVRLAARAHDHGRKLISRFVCGVVGAVRAVALGTHAIFTARTHSGAAVGQIHFVAKLAHLRIEPIQIPDRLASIANGTTIGQTIAWLKRAGANTFNDRFA